jgi:hypothetical protein
MVASIMEMNLLWATCDGHLNALVSCSCNCFRLVICLSRARARLQKLADCSVIAQSNPKFRRQTGVNLLVGRPYAYNTHAYTTQNWVCSQHGRMQCWEAICLFIMAGCNKRNSRFSMVPLPAAVSVCCSSWPLGSQCLSIPDYTPVLLCSDARVAALPAVLPNSYAVSTARRQQAMLLQG